MKNDNYGWPVVALMAMGVAHGSAAHQNDVPEKLRTSLHQEVTLPGSPDQVFKVLLSSKKFSEVTGMKAKIEPKEGGALWMFGGMITGRNIELAPGQRIVQAWRPGSWKPGVYSIVSFSLSAQGGNTLVVLDHKGFPEGAFAGLSDGWKLHYWEPLKKYLK